MKKHKTNLVVPAILITLFLISMGYAALTSNLRIQGITKLNGNTWDVHLEEISGETYKGATITTGATINDDGNAVFFEVTLDKPGDYYEFNVKVVNNGGIKAKLNTVPSITGFSPEQLDIASYSITYDGVTATEVSVGDELDINEEKSIKVRVEYKKDIDNEDMPSSGVTLNTLTLYLNYVQY